VAEAEYTTSARLPIEAIWEFVREIDHWAPMLVGYQSHRKEGPDDSVWVLKGDLGVMTRRVEIRVHVTEWAGPHRVAFALTGLNEPLTGSGEFRMESAGERGAAAGSSDPAKPAKRGPFARLLDTLARWLFRLVHGRAERAAGTSAGPAASTAPAQGLATLGFRLCLEPGGPMAPMLDAMMKPALRPAAEDLANRIVAELEMRHGLR
jgi:carbon monoxide dehydrogenase subunit G